MGMAPRSVPDSKETAWLNSTPNAERVRLQLVSGSLWKFAGFAAAKVGQWVVPPGVYRVLGVGRHVRTSQELVAHVGVNGPDHEKMYFCLLESWARYFTPTWETTPEKTAGPTVTGSGF